MSQIGTHIQRSVDHGLTWTSPAMTLTWIGDIAYDSGLAVAVGKTDYYDQVWAIEASSDGGVTWTKPTFSAATTSYMTAEAYVVGGDLYVSFADQIQPTIASLLRSRDAGLTWQVVESNVGDFAPGPRRNLHIRQQHVPTIYFYELHAYVGESVDFAVHDALGGTLGLIGLGWADALATPFLGGTLWLQGDLVLNAFATSGAPGGPGAGDSSVPFAVPNAPQLVGARLTGQAVVLDAGAAGSLALTNGIEVWMR